LEEVCACSADAVLLLLPCPAQDVLLQRLLCNALHVSHQQMQ
jgi:hypothetical protein